jgi:hypothetical protein
MNKKIIFAVLVILFLFISLLINEYVNQGLGGIFGFLSIGFAYKKIFKKTKEDGNQIILKK